MNTKHKHSKHHTTAVDDNNKLRWWIFAIALIIVAACGLYYFSTHRAQPSASQPNQLPQYSFSNAAYPKFPSELVPKNGTPPQFWEGNGATGMLTIVKEPLAKVSTDYLSALPPSWQVVGKNTTTTATSFMLLNASSSREVKIELAPMPGKSSYTTVMITIQE